MKPRHPHAFVLNVMAADRPGIVASVSQTIATAGGSIDACSQTVLADYFTLIMIVSFPQPHDAQDLCRSILAGAPRLNLQVQARPFEPAQAAPVIHGESFVVTASGPDAEGIIMRFSSYLADKGINILDLYGTLRDEQFVLVGQVSVPPTWDLQMLQAELEQLAQEAGYTVRLQHENVFVATNQLRLPPARAAASR